MGLGKLLMFIDVNLEELDDDRRAADAFDRETASNAPRVDEVAEHDRLAAPKPSPRPTPPPAQPAPEPGTVPEAGGAGPASER